MVRFQLQKRTETVLHIFVGRIKNCLAKKKSALGIFLDIVSAFDNITLHISAAPLLFIDSLSTSSPSEDVEKEVINSNSPRRNFIAFVVKLHS